MKPLSLALLALLLVKSPGLAGTHVVHPDGSGDFPTIQAAIAGAADGDSIMATAGTFLGAGNRDVDFRGKAVVLFSQDGAPLTIIDCEGTAADPHRAFVFVSGETGSSVLEGFTIRNGHAGPTGRAGAISCVDSSPTIRRCVFFANFAGYHAGAIDYLGGGGEILDCRFERNHCGSAGRGGAIRSTAADLVIVGCEFSECTGGWGGALSSEDSSIEVLRSGFSLCQAALAGGAIVAVGGQTHSLRVAECSFDFCISSLGGGIAVQDLNVQITTSIFSTCFGTDGGAMHLSHGGLAASQCTVWNCSAQRGAGLYVRAGSVRLENSIMAFSSQGAGAECLSGSIDLTCCDVFGNAGGDWVGCVAGQQGTNGNLAADPEFCDAAHGDFSLHDSSPCTPAHSGSCGLIGALDVGCGATQVEAATWGRLKMTFLR